MKSVFIFLFSIVYLQTLAQAVPDYSFAAFGLSNDVVKSEEITYEYSDLDNKYIEYEKIVLTFQNGLLTEKLDNYSGLYASTTKTNYTYLNGDISKEVRTYSYSGTATIYTTNYIYKNGKLTEMNYDDSEGKITRCKYFYDAQGKLDKSETRNSIGELINISDYSNVSNEKNYTQMTSYYYGGNLTATDVNTDTYVNGKISSSQSESLDYGEIYYDYEYDTHGNVLKITEDYLDTEVNDYEYDTKGNWIKCKNYIDDWWMGEVEKYKFRKITFKTGTSGSTAFDQNFFNKFPSNVDNDLAEPTTPKQTLPDTPKSSLNPGCEGNCTDGYGHYYHSDGGIYDGFFKESNRNGPGLYTFADGSTYTGNWVNGKKEGFALYGWVDGSAFCGYYKNDKLNGEGIYIDENKAVKGGVFKDGNFEQTFYVNDNGAASGCISGDCYNSFGKMVYSNGDIFLGFFKNGQMSHGVYAYANQDSYIGEFSYGKKHGIGIYSWSDKSYYLGMYQNDSYHGLGDFSDPNNPSSNQIGEFRNGSLYLRM